jgi:hypothetical protein
MRIAIPLLVLAPLLFAACSDDTVSTGSSASGGAGSTGTKSSGTQSLVSSTTTASSTNASSASSSAGGSMGFGDCADSPPCAASDQEVVTFQGGVLPASPQPAIVRAWVFNAKGSVLLETRICFQDGSQNVVVTPYVTFTSSPAMVGTSTYGSASFDPKTSPVEGGTTPDAPVSVTIASLGDVGGLVEGSFDATVSDGTKSTALKGTFKACRQEDLVAP